jgi:hypothetical protein
VRAPSSGKVESAPLPGGSEIDSTREVIAMAKKKSSRKSTGRKTTSSRKKTSGRKKGARRYGKKASEKVERAMHEMKRGQLKSGRSGRKVKSRKQAIAIGLSEAREAGGKVPPPRGRRGGSKRK